MYHVCFYNRVLYVLTQSSLLKYTKIDGRGCMSVAKYTKIEPEKDDVKVKLKKLLKRGLPWWSSG